MKSFPRILVFDSGFGGLTVYSEIIKTWSHAHFTYAADDAVFPYGRLPEADLIARVQDVMAGLIASQKPDIVVIACNTASTLVLPHLRAAFAHVPFVGTVPAIKPAAQVSKSGMVSVLATPGTVARDYTQALIRDYAGHCAVTLVGSPLLASLAEKVMHGEHVPLEAIAAEIMPVFVQGDDGRRTDVVVLACTHYPLLLEQFRQLAPWPVEWIDPAPAIARRVGDVLAGTFERGIENSADMPLAQAIFTSGRRPTPALARLLLSYGLSADVAHSIVTGPLATDA